MYCREQMFFTQRTTNSSKSNHPLNIHIGNTLNDKKVYLRSKNNYGVITILARSRYGKSAMVKQIAYSLWKEKRKIIVLDPFGEWATVGNLNKNVRFPDKVTNVKIVKNFAFKISEMDDPLYWLQLGFSEKSLNYIELIRKHESLYEDNPNMFFEIIETLPDNNAGLRIWNQKFESIPDMQLPTYLHDATYRNILETSKFAKYFFYNPENDSRENVSDWDILLEQSNFLIFDFGLTGTDLDAKKMAGLKCSIVLDKIGFDRIEHYHPVIFVEEADYFVPSEKDMPFSYSRMKFDEMNRKKLRKGMFLVYINQTHDTLGGTVTRDKFQLIVGALPNTDSTWHSLHQNYSKILKKPRLFLYSDEEGKEFLFMSKDTKVGC